MEKRMKTTNKANPRNVKKVGTSVSRKNYKSVFYKQAAGKTIVSIEQMVMDEDGGWSLELTFTDGTILLLDMRARLEVKSQYLRGNNGGLERI